jgi:hypothetical protein
MWATMTQTQQRRSNPVAFKRLMRLGNVSLTEGDYKQAHEYWKQAAMMQPDNEEVWQALLRVLNTPDDRRICLRNILTINPNNKKAQQMLDELIGDTQPEQQPVPSAQSSNKRMALVLRVTRRLAESAIIGVLIATLLLTIRYLLA